MEEELKISLEKAVKGMVLSRDVEIKDYLLIARGTILTPKLIHLLKNYEVKFIWVYYKIQRQEEYEKAYQQTYKQFENVVESIKNGEVIQKTVIEGIIENYLDLPSKYELLRFVKGIREVDQYTYEHSLSVCYLSIMLGQWLKYPYLRNLAQAALLHDLGKMKIKSEILNKPGPLTSVEWEHMKKHPVFGYEFLREKSDFPEDVLKGILHHHESRDGSGYPGNLAGPKIPEISKIITIIDVFDALTSNRVYRKKMDILEALELMSTQYQKFEPEYLKIFCDNMVDQLVGEEVILSNGLVGRIIYRNPVDIFNLLIRTSDKFINVGRDSGIKVAMVL